MLIVISHAPFDKTLSQEAIELTLGLAAVGLEISLLFIGAGVEHLIADQTTSQIASKNFLKNLNCLELYDINKIYVCESSLLMRKITLKDQHANWQIISKPLSLLQNSTHSLIL